MIQILIDLSKLKAVYSGLGQFSLYFGKYVSNIYSQPYFWNFLIPAGQKDLFGIHWNYEKMTAERRFFPKFCKRYDLWHAIHQDSAYLPGDSKTIYILTIHDLNFLEEKRGFKIMRRLRRLQKKADRASYITLISHYTASVANENLNLKNKPQKVIYNGVDINTGKKVHKPAYLPDGPFLFTIGMVLKKKNFHVLVDFMEKLPDYNLIIAGDKTGQYARNLQKKIKQKKLFNRIILPGIITEEDKIYLYRHCEAFLFPSLIEGFGLPVIEAMRFGKPVFCSRRSSLPEVGGDRAFYWDSFDPEEMMEIFVKNLKIFYENIDELSKKNREHSLKFNWKDSIRQYLKVYDEAVQIQKRESGIDLPPVFIKNNSSIRSGVHPERPIKVLHLSSEKSWRGGEQQIAYLIEELNTLGVHNYIACRKNSSFEKYCKEKKWDHYSLNFNPPFDIYTAYQIGRICKNDQIDILHMHTSYGHTLGMLSSLFGCSARLILSRRVDNPIRKNWFTSWKYNHQHIEKILTVSDAIQDILKSRLKDRSKIITVHSGINISKFNGKTIGRYLKNRYHLNNDTILIGNTSALSDHKDYPTFLMVARYIISLGINARFFIIGTGELKEVIQKMITDQQLEEYVIMTGFLNNLATVLPELDIFLMTSKTEGLGTSILDAFASRVPVVATRAGGIPEMVIHEKTGLLSPVKDYKDLGENILRILNDPDLKKKLTTNARKMVLENFSRERTAARTLSIYQEILFPPDGH